MSDQKNPSLIQLSGNGSKSRSGAASAGPKGLQAKVATKSDAVVGLLTRAQGATINQIMNATGWQAHSVRGFIAGPVKKKLGRSVTSEVTPRGRVYRIAPEASE